MLGLLLAGCQGPAPTSPPEDLAALPDDAPSGFDESLPPLPEDAVDEGLRGLTAVLNGDLDLKGSVTAPVGYVDSPASVTQPATTGQIALVRLRATASDAITTHRIYSDLRGPGGAYSSMLFFTNNTSEYKALYVLRNEDLSMRVHNRPSFAGSLNAPAVDVNYTFETRPIEDSSEPNDDENYATDTDRTMAKSLSLGVTATRSFYEYGSSAKDKEDWFKTTLTAGQQYRYRLQSFNPRYGTWGYTLRLLNAAGAQIGSTTTIPTGHAAGNLATPAIPSTGTYYLQIVGNPATKSHNSNVFYSGYTINACQQAVSSVPVYTPSSGIDRCVGSTGQWSTTVSPAPSSYSWNFGGGCTPNTSTAASPSVTLSLRGTFTGTLITTTTCGAAYTRTFTYSNGCNWARTIGTPTARNATPPFASMTDIVVDNQNRAHIVGTMTGTDMQFTAQEPIGTRVLLTPSVTNAAVYVVLNPDGSVNKAMKLIEASASPRGIALTSDQDVRIVGSFIGTGIDFDPGPASLPFNSPGFTNAYCQAISSAGTLQWAVQWGSIGADTATGIAVGAGDGLHIVGQFTNTADFDPGAGTVNKVSDGETDGYWLGLTDAGTHSGVVTIGGTLADDVIDVVLDSSTGVYLVGSYRGTADFNPIGTTTRTSAGSADAFVAKYNTSGVLSWVSAWGSTGADYGLALALMADGDPVVAGGFQGTVDFDPGAGSTTRTSMSSSLDCYAASYGRAGGAFQWASSWGGSQEDFVQDIAVVPGDDRIAVLGTFRTTVDFDPGAGIVSRTAVGLDDMFLAVFNDGGTYHQTSTWGTSEDEAPQAVAAGPTRLMPVGFFGKALDFNPGAGATTITPRGDVDGFVMRLNADATY